jgi:hypothetical protein
MGVITIRCPRTGARFHWYRDDCASFEAMQNVHLLDVWC